jgi:hypothetical protein
VNLETIRVAHLHGNWKDPKTNSPAISEQNFYANTPSAPWESGGKFASQWANNFAERLTD